MVQDHLGLSQAKQDSKYELFAIFKFLALQCDTLYIAQPKESLLKASSLVLIPSSLADSK